jgi:copper chaperone CopZ
MKQSHRLVGPPELAVYASWGEREVGKKKWKGKRRSNEIMKKMRTSGIALMLATALSDPFAWGEEKQDQPPASDSVVAISIEGMICGSCMARVKKTLKRAEGVKEVKISLKDREAKVKYDGSKTVPDSLVNAINRLGYHASLPKKAKKE